MRKKPFLPLILLFLGNPASIPEITARIQTLPFGIVVLETMFFKSGVAIFDLGPRSKVIGVNIKFSRTK